MLTVFVRRNLWPLTAIFLVSLMVMRKSFRITKLSVKLFRKFFLERSKEYTHTDHPRIEQSSKGTETNYVFIWNIIYFTRNIYITLFSNIYLFFFIYTHPHHCSANKFIVYRILFIIFFLLDSLCCPLFSFLVVPVNSLSYH